MNRQIAEDGFLVVVVDTFYMKDLWTSFSIKSELSVFTMGLAKMELPDTIPSEGIVQVNGYVICSQVRQAQGQRTG